MWKCLHFLYPSCYSISGLRKSLTEALKLRHCQAIALWINPVINQLYWCVRTPEGDDRRSIVREKFISTHNHVSNQHTFPGAHFTACTHPPITEERIWLTLGKHIHSMIINFSSYKAAVYSNCKQLFFESQKMLGLCFCPFLWKKMFLETFNIPYK